MDILLLVFVVAIFLAAMLLFEGVWLLWHSSRSAEALRLRSRLDTLAAGGALSKESLLVRERLMSDAPWLDRLLRRMPNAHLLDRLLYQSGLEAGLGSLLRWSLTAAVAGVVAWMLLPLPAWSLPLALCAGACPLVWVLRRRRQRLGRMEAQLPDALELMSRAMRAGHALPSAMSMVGTEGPEPVAAEFRAASDEINYGVSLQDALGNIALRVPITDLRFFCVSVLIQRETGGNLAELLDKLAALMRGRFKLLATIRVLSAEGRLSGWILTILPFALLALINIINPRFMSILWKDPAGLYAVYAGLGLMVIGIVWMWRVVRIRV